MNQRKSKQLKREVADRLYEAPENREQRKNIYKESDFKKVYRSRKKNYIKGIIEF